MELQQQITSLRDKLDRRAGQLRSVRNRVPRGRGRSATTRGASTQPLLMEPTLSQIKLGGYSGVIDTNDDGRDDTVRLYVTTLDQEGRLLPVVAKATVQVVNIPQEGEPQRLASRSYSSKQFNDAYRSSFTGDHYTLETELPDSLPQKLEDVTVKVTVTHAASDTSFSAQQTYRLRRE